MQNTRQHDSALRRVSGALANVIAALAVALFVWSVVEHEVGYAVASAMLTISAINAIVRGPGVRPMATV